MSILDANVKTSICEKQFYQTLPEQIDALCWFLNNQYGKDITILDAGSGEGNIKYGLLKNGYKNIKTNDLYFASDFEGDFLKYDFSNIPEFGLTISNVPYISRDKTKYRFIDKSIDISGSAFILLPLQMLNYIYFCENYLDTEIYGGRITMYPKVILNKEGKVIQGGNTGYGWFWFSKYSSSFTGSKFEEFIDTRKYRK